MDRLVSKIEELDKLIDQRSEILRGFGLTSLRRGEI